jgi:diguanylate cyclase (GGDEF)-like protein
MAISSERARAPGIDAPCSPTPSSELSSTSADNRRQHVRHELRVDATVGIKGGPSRACQIEDFCPGGLFLTIEGANGSGIAIGDKALERFDELVVRFSADANGTVKEFEVTVLVARVVSGGVGVSFEGRNGAAIHALNHLLSTPARVNTQAAGASAAEGMAGNVADVADASSVLSAYRRRVVLFLESNLGALFEHAKDNLFASARDTRDREEQTAFFDAIQELDGLQDPVQTAFLDSMNSLLQQPGARVPGTEALVSETGTLDVALVDTGTFDDWVVIKDIISRATPKYDERQREIAARLSNLLKTNIDDDSNPVGLTGLGLTFHDAIQNFGASHSLRQAILRSFEETIVSGLGTLYDDLNNILSNREVSSEVERTVADRPLSPRQDKGDSAKRAAAQAAAAAEESELDAVESGASKPLSSLGIDPASITPPPVVVGNLLHTARSLLILERQAKASDNLPAALTDMAGAQPVPPPAMGSKSLDQVIDALSILQRSPKFTAIDDKGPLALKERLMTTWRAAGLRVADGEGDAVEVISNLLDAILDDPLVTPRVKACVRRLAIALVKVALQDRELFNDENHPARQLINQLGRVELAEDGSVIANGAWQMTIDPLVDRIVHSYERDTVVFNQVLVEVENIVERQEQHLSTNVARIVQERNQQQALVDSRRDSAPAGNGATQASTDSNMPTEWKRWLSRVELLQAGDVVFLDKNGERPEKLRLVWVSSERDSYLFASHCGDKTSTLTRQELAMHFRRGAARVLDASDLPVVDRGIYRLLNVLHTRLAKKASHDGVTGMLNRKAFEAALGQTMTEAVRMATNHVLCVLEIDEFRTIVEKCGRKAGTGLLRKLARVLDKHVGKKGMIGRLTKGRFAMLLNNCDLQEGRAIADRQRKSMEKSRCVWQGESFQLTVSVGMVSLDGHNRATVAELIDAAGNAFEEAHGKGGNRIQIGEQGKAVQVSSESVVLKMLAEKRLQLRCQRLAPIGSDTSAKSHFEILLGVKDANGEVAMPRDFIQSAERNNEMHEVDMWVIRNALGWMAKHRSKVDAVGGYSINLSGLTLGDDSLLRYVLERLTESQVPPSKIIFEITESAAINTLSVAVNFINTLKEYGCRFALDDFGTGDASFAYLKTLPIDFVKIDGSIVRDIVNSPKDLALVKSINEIGHFLGKKTVAEFVENDDILARLRQMGVDFAQGYGIEAPYVLT